MSLHLHLSDLHLGNAAGEDDVGDYSKSEAVSTTDRVTRSKLLSTTLRALDAKLRQTGDVLDSVVITGDVTTKSRKDGFDALPEMLASLGDSLPSPERIVVVPGNHDVKWGTAPGSKQRYADFIAGTRKNGYVTPLLDGIDYAGHVARPDAQPLLIGDDFVVVALNSANWCGVQQPLPDEVADAVKSLVANGHLSSDLAKEVERLEMYDMPRISPQQLEAVAERVSVAADGSARVRIGALHHQLVPVREEEEVKPYESLVNLAQILRVLGDGRFDLILHGHKHADKVQTLWLDDAGRPHRAVVASCGHIGRQHATGQEIAKLIRVNSELPTLRSVSVESIPAVGAGASLRNRVTQVYTGPTSRPAPDTAVTVIGGTTAADVHEQLLELAKAGPRPRRDVVCVINVGATAVDPPATFPWTQEVPEPLAQWFPETVAWWQSATPADGKPFTHGQRLRAWGNYAEDAVDQLQNIADVLRASPRTSRAVAVLIDPTVDDIADRDVAFPSFSLLHIWIEGHRLHCTAFFRKQEMRFWWAVNAAEIASIQSQLVTDLTSIDADLAPGAIRTYTSEAVFSDNLPKVNVPRIDREFWDAPESFIVFAVAIADVDADGRDGDLSRFLDLLEESAPTATSPPADGAPVPGPGLVAVLRHLEVLATRYAESPAEEVAETLRDMRTANQLYLNTRDADAVTAYAEWQAVVVRKVRRLRELLQPEPTNRAGRGVAKKVSPAQPPAKNTAATAAKRVAKGAAKSAARSIGKGGAGAPTLVGTTARNPSAQKAAANPAATSGSRKKATPAKNLSRS